MYLRTYFFFRWYRSTPILEKCRMPRWKPHCKWMLQVCCMFWRLFVASVLMKLNLDNSEDVGKKRAFLCILKLVLGRRQWHRQPKDAPIINASRHLFVFTIPCRKINRLICNMILFSFQLLHLSSTTHQRMHTQRHSSDVKWQEGWSQWGVDKAIPRFYISPESKAFWSNCAPQHTWRSLDGCLKH